MDSHVAVMEFSATPRPVIHRLVNAELSSCRSCGSLHLCMNIDVARLPSGALVTVLAYYKYYSTNSWFNAWATLISVFSGWTLWGQELGQLEIKHGLLQVAETLNFIHNNARLIHRAISPEVRSCIQMQILICWLSQKLHLWQKYSLCSSYLWSFM